MKIRKIKLSNHALLNNLELDFTDEDNNCVDTIIFAGENGTGKTSILELLYELSNLNITNHDKRNEQRSFEVELSEDEINLLLANENYKSHFGNGIGQNIFTIKIDYNIIGNWNQIKVIFNDSLDDIKEITGDFLIHPELNRIIRCVYSDAEINYTPRKISSVTSKNIDISLNRSYKSDNNLATDITQLLIDIQTLDSQEFANWGKENIGTPVDESKLDTRIRRFTNAFDMIFPTKKFIGIENINNSKEVMFEENGKKMSIDKLSSGEKQIVFRGGFFLKDKEINNGINVLLDEPEISLHPNWQMEILDFYKNILFDAKTNTSQLFVATHSPFIIHNSKRYNDKVIILSKNENSDIYAINSPEYYSWTKNKIVQQAFKINIFDNNSTNKLYLEGETDELYFQKAKEIFNIESLNYDISWIGRINNNGNPEFTGDTALNHVKAFYLANSNVMNSKVVLYYDSDTNKPEETFDKLFIKKMPKNHENNLYKIGIENLLNLSDTFNKDNFYSIKNKTDDYGAESVIKTLNKTKLCHWVCNECSIEEQKEILKNIKPLLIETQNQIST